LIRFNRQREQLSKEMTSRVRGIEEQAINLAREKEFMERLQKKADHKEERDDKKSEAA